MTDQQQPRPPLWRSLDTVDDNLWNAELIRAFAQYILDHGLIGAQLLEVLEEEARRAERGE